LARTGNVRVLRLIKLMGLGGYIRFFRSFPHFSLRNFRFYWYSSSFFILFRFFPFPSVFFGKSISCLASRSAKILHIQLVYKCTHKFAPAPAPATPAVPAAPAAPAAKNIQLFLVLFRFFRYSYVLFGRERERYGGRRHERKHEIARRAERPDTREEARECS